MANENFCNSFNKQFFKFVGYIQKQFKLGISFITSIWFVTYSGTLETIVTMALQVAILYILNSHIQLRIFKTNLITGLKSTTYNHTLDMISFLIYGKTSAVKRGNINSIAF